MSLQGLAPILRRMLRGAVHPPKAKRHHEASTPTASSYYEGMHGDYRWFRQDELVRRCVLVNAFFATMASGFETVLEATREGVDAGDYAYVKKRVDQANKAVNLDQALFVGVLQRLADLRHDGKGLVSGKVALADYMSQVCTVDKFHDEIVQVV